MQHVEEVHAAGGKQFPHLYSGGKFNMKIGMLQV
jgi:hypothetical protein